MKEDDLSFKTTAYIISSISSYYGNDFNAAYNYVINNKDSLASIQSISIVELDKLIIISFDITKPVIIQ